MHTLLWCNPYKINKPMVKLSNVELSPREATLQFLKMFARNYMPLGTANSDKSVLACN